MNLPRCPYCRRVFTPSRYRPDQAICSDNACQRRRRADYHRKKRLQDPVYDAQCRDSQKQWRDEHPDYMRQYRNRGPATNPNEKNSARELRRLLESVKNNVAIDLAACPAKVWLIAADQSVKNILATAELIVVKALSLKEAPGEPSKEHLLGAEARSTV